MPLRRGSCGNWDWAHECPSLCDLLCPWRFSRQDIGEGCHALLQGNLPNPQTEPMSPTLADWFFSAKSPGKPRNLGNSQEIRRSIGVCSTITNSFISFRNLSPKGKRLPSPRTCLICVAPALALGQPQKVLHVPSSSLKYSPYQCAPHTLNTWLGSFHAVRSVTLKISAPTGLTSQMRKYTKLNFR